MDENAQRRPLQDKRGCFFEIGACGLEVSPCLMEMYLLFSPSQASQGLPPQDSRECREWVERMLKEGENFLVLREDQAVGHAALLPDFERKDAEYITFVDKAFRGRGLGSALTRAAVDRARALGLEVVWLTVTAHNFIAIKLYRKFGFEFADEGGWERAMILRL